MSMAMTKADKLETARRWLNLAYEYMYQGKLGKAESCLAISIRTTNEACLSG